ncbi:GNAT family N-acetyltransferase [Amycolatopsis jiangsuensis]|uniref:Ribosomal protein S18 acetylase RimI-like enzyme n=1 Tax=Amycolatopsis jiangsuensis TaxID=1181879 RepID=A0A840J2P8_9PSEU|nr:GNAT family N-acetyltransferase [Amycolatopsis jiangsuensis]MBB4687554.1 ribosomal protein S18 acetylase RimI-like enzyme [Amycolatopsis jiangsuensis]
MSAIQAYVRATAPRGRDTERIGPFLATFSRDTSHRMLNYAIPDDDAAPSPGEIAALTAAYRGRDLLPRLEFFTEAAPALEAALTAAGYRLECRIPLMTCTSADFVDRPAPDGFRLREPGCDADRRKLRSVQSVAYGAGPDVSDAEVETVRKHLHVLAEDIATGEIAGGGMALEIVSGTTEVAGIAVAGPYRGRGIAAAISALLTRISHDRGADTAFLTPRDQRISTVYRRVGYRTAGECVHLSLPQ